MASESNPSPLCLYPVLGWGSDTCASGSIHGAAADSRAIDQFAGGAGNRLSTNPGGVYCDDSDHNDGPLVDFYFPS